MTRYGMHPNSIANLKKGGAKTRFQPGVSGNPGGKPRSLYDIQAAARKKSPEAFKIIIKVMEDEKTAPSLKVKCAEYGDHGDGFIECHHTKPVSELQVGEKTKLSDLALVCSNCHRMIHRKRPWLSVDGIRTLLSP